MSIREFSINLFEDIPLTYKYIAQDYDGSIYAYQIKPVYDDETGMWVANERDNYIPIFVPSELAYQQSLVNADQQILSRYDKK